MNHGKIAYEAYCKSTGGKSLISGAALPPWEELKPDIQDAWTAAGYAVGDAWCNEVLLRPMAEVVKESARKGFANA